MNKQSPVRSNAFSARAWRIAFRDAALIVIGCSVVALGVNAARSDGIRLVQHEAYEILVPCPEPVGDAKQMAASSPLLHDAKSLLLDVRSKEEFASWHLPGAINQPFDWLGPPVDSEVAQVAKRVAASGARRVVVYGDGDDPDSGKEWAKLLSGARIKNVFFVKGGAPAINPKLPKPSDDDDDDDELDDDSSNRGGPSAATSAAPSGSASPPAAPKTKEVTP